MARITLKTIAKEAGVSVATVSLALRGQGKLSKENVARIRKIAERLGYTPDPMLASLASKRFRGGEQASGQPLALLEFPAHEGSAASTPQYRECLIEHARRLGYAPTVYSLEEMRRYNDFPRTLYHRGTQALILSGQPDPAFFEHPESWASYAIVQCGRYRSTLPIHTVRPNIFQAVKLCFEKVHERGYKRIGFAIGRHPEVLEDDLARLGAALAMLDQHVPKKNRIPPYFDELKDIDKMLRWGEKNKVDAYIAFNVGFWYQLKARGIACPEDVGMAALHHGKTESDRAAIAGLDQSKEEIAYQSMLLVDQMVRHNERGIPRNPRQILISSNWVDGASLRPLASDGERA